MSRSLSRRLPLLLAAAAAASCAAADAVAPRPPTMTAVEAAAQLTSGIALRGLAHPYDAELQVALAAISAGAHPVPIVATANGNTVTYQSASLGMVAYHTGDRTGWDSIVVVVAWRGDSAQQGFLLLRNVPLDSLGRTIPGAGLGVGVAEYWNGRNIWVSDVTTETLLQMADAGTECIVDPGVDGAAAQDALALVSGTGCTEGRFAASAAASLAPFGGTPDSTPPAMLRVSAQATTGIRVRFDGT